MLTHQYFFKGENHSEFINFHKSYFTILFLRAQWKAELLIKTAITSFTLLILTQHQCRALLITKNVCLLINFSRHAPLKRAFSRKKYLFIYLTCLARVKSSINNTYKISIYHTEWKCLLKMQFRLTFTICFYFLHHKQHFQSVTPENTSLLFAPHYCGVRHTKCCRYLFIF